MRNQTLRRRIATAFILMAIVLCGFFSLAAYLSVELVESQLIDQRLEKEATHLIDQHINHRPPDPEEINFFINEKIPEQFRSLPVGLHEVMVGGKEITVIIRKVGNDTFAITDDTSDFEITEVLIFMSIAAGFVASVVLAVILGTTFARRIVAPVTELANAVTHNEEPTDLPSLTKEDEVGMLSRAFAARTEQLQQFLSDEKLFTGDVSHELRTPLTIILGAAELLESRLSNSPDELIVAQRIRRIADEAAERVGALLMLSQPAQGRAISSLSLVHVIEREVDRYQPLLENKPVKIVFDCDHDIRVHAPAELAGIAIGNLIRNACQYTEKGTIRIRLGDDMLTIEDNGPGIPENVRARLFTRFIRGESSPHVGSGLGLAIVKRVSDYLGWQIQHQAPEQGGSRFILRFEAPSSN